MVAPNLGKGESVDGVLRNRADLAVVKGIAETLEGPANGGDCAEDARGPVTAGEHLYSLDETSRAGAGDADDPGGT